MRLQRLLPVVLLALSVMADGVAAQQSFPSRQVRIVVPYPPGGPVDALARIVAAEMQASLGQPVIVENKAGASGAVGTRDVARAEADGHTLVLGTNQTHATNQVLLKEPGYDPLKDFAAVSGLADLQHVLVVRKDLAARDVAGLIALAKADPGKLNCGSTGPGSASHLTLELFQTRAGIKITHVPFRGAAPMALEIVGGRIDCAFATLPSVLGQVEGGEMRALAVASSMRAPQLAAVPRLAEEGVRDAEGDAWIALFAPGATPPAVLARLGQSVVGALAKPDVRAAVAKLGIALNVRDAKAFAPYWSAEVKKWTEVVRAAGVKPE